MFKYVLTKWVEKLLKKEENMFIIIEYKLPNYDNIHIAKCLGQPVVFGSKHTARKYAEKECVFNYKIVEL